jgi:hypothetical protein
MSPPGSPPDWEEFRRAMRDLEARVAQLEARLGAPREAIAAPAPTAAAPAAPATPALPAHLALAAGAGAVPAAGRALLGIAGAYVLRALTESHALAQQAGVSAGILYSMLWLAWAARVARTRRVEAVLYSSTSALILAPLLWESTVRLHAVSTWAAALVLLLFTLFGLVISWRRDLLLVATIATLTGVLSAGALLIGTYDLLPFTFLLLAIAAAVEASACLEHWLSERWVAALAADLAVLLAAILVTRPAGLPEGYAPVSHAALLAAVMALPAIYLGSVMVRTLLRGFAFTGFETAQLALALFLAVGGGLRLAGGNPRLAVALAAVCLFCGAACYLLAFRLGSGRNAATYGVFGLMLVLVGTRIAIPPLGAAAAWTLLALAGMAWPRQPLQWHAGVYLLVALVASAALTSAGRILLGGDPPAPTPAALLWEGAAAAACYGVAARGAAPRVFRGILAAAAVWLLAGACGAGLTSFYHGLFGALAPHAYCATLRTAVLAAGALLVAALVSQGKRSELAPLVYLLMALGAYRLLLVDLRQEIKTAVVLSLLVYGTALTLLPRLMQRGQAGNSLIPS